MVWIQIPRPIAIVSCCQRGFSYVGTKIFSNLPTSVLNLRNDKVHFQAELQRYLTAYSFSFTCRTYGIQGAYYQYL